MSIEDYLQPYFLNIKIQTNKTENSIFTSKNGLPP